MKITIGIAVVTLAEVLYMVGGRVSPAARPELAPRIRTAAHENPGDVAAAALDASLRSRELESTGSVK
jgi:hypothetical protein